MYLIELHVKICWQDNTGVIIGMSRASYGQWQCMFDAAITFAVRHVIGRLAVS
jgi:hypothetical protein